MVVSEDAVLREMAQLTSVQIQANCSKNVRAGFDIRIVIILSRLFIHSNSILGNVGSCFK